MAIRHSKSGDHSSSRRKQNRLIFERLESRMMFALDGIELNLQQLIAPPSDSGQPIAPIVMTVSGAPTITSPAAAAEGSTVAGRRTFLSMRATDNQAESKMRQESRYPNDSDLQSRRPQRQPWPAADGTMTARIGPRPPFLRQPSRVATISHETTCDSSCVNLEDRQFETAYRIVTAERDSESVSPELKGLMHFQKKRMVTKRVGFGEPS